MAEVFLQELFRRSIVGGILILAVMLMRLLLQRAPKRVLVYSWILVGAALIFPVFLQSSWSLLPTVLQRGGRNVVRSERTVELVQAEIQNPAASSSEYDDVPKTSDNSLVLWILGVAAVFAAGSFGFRKAAK